MNTDESIERLKTTGRNDPCPCGSGKKYKKCHLFEDEAAQHEQMKKAADEREAALAAAEKENDEQDETSGKDQAQSKKAFGQQQQGGHARGSQSRPSNIPRRGAV